MMGTRNMTISMVLRVCLQLEYQEVSSPSKPTTNYCSCQKPMLSSPSLPIGAVKLIQISNSGCLKMYVLTSHDVAIKKQASM